MEFREVLTGRRGVRTYADRPVPREVLERIANAAVVWAPSAGFSQGLRIVVVTDPETRRRIAAAGKEDELAAEGRPRWMSAAQTAIFGVIDVPALREALGLPADLRFVAVARWVTRPTARTSRAARERLHEAAEAAQRGSPVGAVGVRQRVDGRCHASVTGGGSSEIARGPSRRGPAS